MCIALQVPIHPRLSKSHLIPSGLALVSDGGWDNCWSRLRGNWNCTPSPNLSLNNFMLRKTGKTKSTASDQSEVALPACNLLNDVHCFFIPIQNASQIRKIPLAIQFFQVSVKRHWQRVESHGSSADLHPNVCKSLRPWTWRELPRIDQTELRECGVCGKRIWWGFEEVLKQVYPNLGRM